MSRTLRILFSAAVALAGCAAAGFAQTPEARAFRDWVAECNELARCMAETQNLAGAPSDFTLRLARAADEARWNLVLVASAALPAQPVGVDADLDGTAFAFEGPDGAAAFGDPAAVHLLGEAATELMQAMAPASAVGFGFEDAEGNRHVSRFSLAGLSASLLWIDEKQGRVGAPREAGDLPQGLERAGASGSDAELPEEVLIVHDREGECDPLADLPHGNDAVVVPLNDERTMYLVPCYAGAYNFAYAAYTMEDSRVKRKWFADYYDHAGWTATDVIVNPDWEGGGLGRLSMFDKGRGLGDCGSTALWQVSDGDLRMLKFTYKGDCDGEGEPGDFPVVFEAERNE